MENPVVLYICRQETGGGNFLRTVAVASRLVARFRVIILSGGRPPDRSSIPADIEVLQLPARTRNSNGFTVRCKFILNNYERLRPAALIFESFPFNFSADGDELLPLIEAVGNSRSSRPVIICNPEDSPPGNHELSNIDQIAHLIERYFDAIIVNSDPQFARLQEYFQPRRTFSTPVYHSGFVVRSSESSFPTPQRERRVLVSAGDGSDGGALLRAAIGAHPVLWDAERLPMTVIAGPGYPRRDWDRDAKQARGLPGLELTRSVSDPGAEFAGADWIVSHCTYSAMVEVLASGVSALLLPGGRDGHDQEDRVQRMVNWRAALTLGSRYVNGASLASSVHQLLAFQPATNDFNIDGAEITANIIYELVQNADAGNLARIDRTLGDQKRIH